MLHSTIQATGTRAMESLVASGAYTLHRNPLDVAQEAAAAPAQRPAIANARTWPSRSTQPYMYERDFPSIPSQPRHEIRVVRAPPKSHAARARHDPSAHAQSSKKG
jgi:hypothetical protein